MLFNACVWDNTTASLNYLPLDDSLYPYADIPRLVIETDNFSQIRDNTTEHPGKLQIYEQTQPTSDVLNLTIRGRGFSSFVMPKCSYKIEFVDKQELFGMPKNRDWDLISNFRDKSLLRNAISYQLANTLEAPYAPRFRFIELYLNREYKGIYFLVEHIKVAKNRVNIPKDGSSFLVEKTSEKDVDIKNSGSSGNYIDDEGTVYFSTDAGYLFEVKYPKEPSEAQLNCIKNHFSEFENFMNSEDFANLSLDTLETWIDITDFIRYYWIQEFSKNIDGAFRRSIFLTWQKGYPIQMGPVWDFDLGYGIGNDRMMSSCDFYVRTQSWYKLLFLNKEFKQKVNEYWENHSKFFLAVNDSIPILEKTIHKAVNNDEKRWPIMDNDKDWPFVESYPNYDATIESLRNWIYQRVNWISNHL